MAEFNRDQWIDKGMGAWTQGKTGRTALIRYLAEQGLEPGFFDDIADAVLAKAAEEYPDGPPKAGQTAQDVIRQELSGPDFGPSATGCTEPPSPPLAP